MNIRELASALDYSHVNREERNLAAIVFARLVAMTPDSVKLFIQALDERLDDRCSPWLLDREQFGIYFEYAYLRDAWYNLKTDDKKYEALKLMTNELEQEPKPAIIEAIEKRSASGINRIANQKYVKSKQPVSPSQWSSEKILQEANNNSDLYRCLMKIKKSFSAKPDLVIHFDREHVVCVEMKLDTHLKPYVWDQTAAGDNGVSQTGLQHFMLTRCLGFNCDNVVQLLVGRSKEEDEEHALFVSWTRFLDELDKFNTSAADETTGAYLRKALEYARSQLVDRP